MRNEELGMRNKMLLRIGALCALLAALCAFGMDGACALCPPAGAFICWRAGADGRDAEPGFPPCGAANVVVNAATHARPATMNFVMLLFITHLLFLFWLFRRS